MTDQPKLSQDIKAALQEDCPPSDTTVMAWMVRANFLERQLAEVQQKRDEDYLTYLDDINRLVRERNEARAETATRRGAAVWAAIRRPIRGTHCRLARGGGRGKP